MTIKSYKLGPGTLKLGPAGVHEASAQLRKCQVTPKETVTTDPAVPVLSGEELPAEDTATYTFEISGTVLQDLEAAGFVAYTWLHKGEELAFEFIPNTVAARKVSGTARIVPVVIGGEVKTRPTSDFTWRCTGDDPEFDDV